MAAFLALVPAAQAAPSLSLKVNVEGEGLVYCEAEFEGEIEFEFEECGDTELFLPEGAEVFLLAAEAGDEFKEFKGCDVAEFEECELTMDESREVTAVFGPEPVNENTLSIAIAGTGAGQVECELEEGPEPCKSIYPEETEFSLTEVTLVPVEGEGSEFAGFSGDCSGLVCELTMDEDHVVTATFDLVEGEEETGGGGGTNPGSDPSPAQIVGPLPLSKVRVGGAALYKGSRAMLRLTCKGPGHCVGKVKLFAKLRLGKGDPRRVLIGEKGFSLPAGYSRTVKIKLSRRAKGLLRRGRTVVAKVGGPGVVRSKLRIKPTSR